MRRQKLFLSKHFLWPIHSLFFVIVTLFCWIRRLFFRSFSNILKKKSISFREIRPRFTGIEGKCADHCPTPIHDFFVIKFKSHFLNRTLRPLFHYFRAIFFCRWPDSNWTWKQPLCQLSHSTVSSLQYKIQCKNLHLNWIKWKTLLSKQKSTFEFKTSKVPIFSTLFIQILFIKLPPPTSPPELKNLFLNKSCKYIHSFQIRCICAETDTA